MNELKDFVAMVIVWALIIGLILGVILLIFTLAGWVVKQNEYHPKYTHPNIIISSLNYCVDEYSTRSGHMAAKVADCMTDLGYRFVLEDK